MKNSAPRLIGIAGRVVAACVSAVILAGCATAYEPTGFSGGFQEQQVNADTWRVSFAANGYTSRETAQTYWLYRCAQLTLEKGYAGFRVVSPMMLAELDRRAHRAAIVVSGQAVLERVQFQYPTDNTKPYISGDIRMLKAPLTVDPPHSFDAAALKAALEPHVNGPKCDGNVCPHVHAYLYPPA